MGRKSSFTDEQTIRALKKVDAGAKAAAVCRRLGVSERTFYRWKGKYGRDGGERRQAAEGAGEREPAG
jgi:putative transposase